MPHKKIIAVLSIFPFIFSIPTINNKQVFKGEIQRETNFSMEKLNSYNNSLMKQLEAKEKEYKEQQRKIAEEKRHKEIEEQKKRVNIPQYVLNRGGGYRKVRLRVSYYTVSKACCGNTLGITKSGKKIQDGMIAAPPNITLGTQIYFNNRIYTVEDRGGAITMNNGIVDVDVYVPGVTNKQLMNLGVKYVDGWILD